MCWLTCCIILQVHVAGSVRNDQHARRVLGYQRGDKDADRERPGADGKGSLYMYHVCLMGDFNVSYLGVILNVVFK